MMAAPPWGKTPKRFTSGSVIQASWRSDLVLGDSWSRCRPESLNEPGLLSRWSRDDTSQPLPRGIDDNSIQMMIATQIPELTVCSPLPQMSAYRYLNNRRHRRMYPRASGGCIAHHGMSPRVLPWNTGRGSHSICHVLQRSAIPVFRPSCSWPISIRSTRQTSHKVPTRK